MNSKLLLVNGITLLYRENQLPGTHENSATLVREIIANIKLPEISFGIDHERDILAGLKATAQTMCDTPLDHQYELAELLQRLKVNTIDAGDLYEALQDGMSAELTESGLKRTCLNIKRTLNNHFREEKVNEIMNKATQLLKFNRNKITDMKRFVTDVCAQLEPYQVDHASKDPAVISDVNMNNLQDITAVFSEVCKNADGTKLLKTGWQGINRMLGGGFKRGEEWVIGALQHQYKTGFSLALFRQIAIYNTPVLTDPTKKPLLLRISFEDSLTLNFQAIYQAMVQNETGKIVSVVGLTDEHMALYIQKALAVTGYHTQFMNVNPSLWSYVDICNKIIALEAEGYEVHMCMLDYLLKIPTTGCDTGPMGTDIRNLYERIRNFMNARNILVITPHQLSPAAKMLIREGKSDFVKDLVGKGYYSGTTQLDQICDGELFIHIEIINNESNLTVQRGKHRGVDQTPREHHYCVLPFTKIDGVAGCILDDVNGPDTARLSPGGGAIGSGNEKVFWEFD